MLLGDAVLPTPCMCPAPAAVSHLSAVTAASSAKEKAVKGTVSKISPSWDLGLLSKSGESAARNWNGIFGRGWILLPSQGNAQRCLPAAQPSGRADVSILANCLGCTFYTA